MRVQLACWAWLMVLSTGCSSKASHAPLPAPDGGVIPTGGSGGNQPSDGGSALDAGDMLDADAEIEPPHDAGRDASDDDDAGNRMDGAVADAEPPAPDEDGDGLPDALEGDDDYDEDGVPNSDDSDSDQDCRSDAAESQAGEEPHLDTDGDGRPDRLDRDGDNDTLYDQHEDRDCDGALDPGESSPLLADTDADGWSDVIEFGVETDANDAQDDPDARGYIVFIAPFSASAVNATILPFRARHRAVDAYVLVDRSASMEDELASIRADLGAALDTLRCPPAGSGAAETCIESLWAGAGAIGFVGGSGAYTHAVDMQPSPDLTAIPADEPLGCCSEATSFALWRAISGFDASSSGCTPGGEGRLGCAGTPAQSAGYATYGEGCMRKHALPVFVVATDDAPLTNSESYVCPDYLVVRVALSSQSSAGHIVGVLGSGASSDARDDLSLLAAETGAVDFDTDAPIVVDGADGDAAEAVVEAVNAAVTRAPLDVWIGLEGDFGPLVARVETYQDSTVQCPSGYTVVQTGAENLPDYFSGVSPGSALCFRLVALNDVPTGGPPPAGNGPFVSRSTVRAIADDSTGLPENAVHLDSRTLYFVTPPAAGE